MAGGGFGNSPWGQNWGGGYGDSSVTPTEHIPTSPLWTQFDLTGVRQPNDMDRVLSFIEVTGLGAYNQFFINSFNLASGGSYPTTPAILDIDVAVTSTFSVEYRLQGNALPDGFDDPVFSHMLLAVNNATSGCASLLLSLSGVAYTGAIHFTGPNNDVVFDHDITVLPGSDEWFDEGQDITVRLVLDWQTQLVYLYVTPTANIVEGAPGADSTGHVLRALLPVLLSSTATFPPIDRISVSVRGPADDESNLELFHYNLTSRRLVPDLPPRAIVGPDQAARLCSIVQLDGTASFDPEGHPIEYDWRLIDAPNTSQFVVVGVDGRTVPQAIPTGFTDTFFSDELGTVDVVEPITIGDVVLVAGLPYTITAKKPSADPPPFYVVVERPQIPDDLSNATFKVLRQTGITQSHTAKPTFFPDVAGFYLFDLQVFDGTQWSTPTGTQRATSVVNVLESPLPRGCTPNVSFLFDYLSDFWQLVEDSEKIAVFWGALAQVASTELFTLWQHEYSKSIRDIQRQFARRWLHYDTLLGEPIPELTRLFPVWGGVDSSVFTSLSVNNRRLGLSSPMFSEDLVITFSGLDPVDPVSFAAGLERELQQVHSSFTVRVIPVNAGGWFIRLNAGFGFEVTSVTTAPFAVGAENGVMRGTGVKTDVRSFKVDRSLTGLDLVSAFIIFGGRAYPIERVVDVPTDEFKNQRVIVADALPALPDGSDPTNPEANWVISGWVSSELLDFYSGLVSDQDHVDFEVLQEDDNIASASQISEVISTVALGASESQPSRLPVDFWPIGHLVVDPALSVRLARVTRRSYIPVDSTVLDIPTLQEKVVVEDDTATLRRNLDFYIELFRGRNAIRFVSGQGGGADVFEGQRPPIRLWAEYTYLDNNLTIQNNFGEVVGLHVDQLPSNTDYLSAVSGLLYAYTNGPTVRNLRIGTQILLGLPFAEEDGVIEEIRKDLLTSQGRILIRDTNNPEIVRSYTFPKVLDLETNPKTGEEYKVGDTVVRFDPLVKGGEVLDYVKDPTWFQGILNQGVFYEVQKYHTFAIRVDGRAFSLNSLLFVRDFILKIKPTYTYPKFIVELIASDIEGDEISVNDTVLMNGTLSLDDTVCAGRLGSSFIFDEPWAGGGQPWAGDPDAHNSSWRNRFDNNDDPSVSATYPVAESVHWGFDKGYLCPLDDVSISFCENFPAPFVPTFDSVFSFDTDVLTSFEGEDNAPISILAGPAGTTLTLTSPVVTVAGSLYSLRIAFIGATGVGVEADYEALVYVNAVLVLFTPFSTATNTEVFLALAGAVSPGDVLEVHIRTLSGLAASPEWTRILTKLSVGSTWSFDTMLPAGDYCGGRQLVGDGSLPGDLFLVLDEDDDLVVDDEEDFVEFY